MIAHWFNLDFSKPAPLGWSSKDQSAMATLAFRNTSAAGLLMTESHRSTSEPGPMSWSEKERQYNKLATELGGYADEMVHLLAAHGEVNWTNVFARFGDLIRAANSDKKRRAAIEQIGSIHGGMGSWNDFYLQALGEAEARRTDLSFAISEGCGRLTELMNRPPYETPRGLLSVIARFLF